jgi:dolichyl-phosphate-mannose-protein mannosyltransferase
MSLLFINFSVTIAVRNRLWNSAGFFMLIWAVHYIPFFLMNRQLFVHHYLPSHLASALVAGAILSFILSESINYPISIRGPKTKAKPSQFADLGVKGPATVAVFGIILFLMYVYMAPLTYGTPG